MEKPVLIVMAAGMGSRYGGLKQLVAVGPNQQALMDYSLFDAKRAGFERAVFVISPGMAEEGFEKDIKERIGRDFDVRCAVQRLDDIPEGFQAPEGRMKPWGTGHAIRACRGLVDAPFAAINADDYYGPEGYQQIYSFLRNVSEPCHYAMVGYSLTKTLSKTGYVARGVCHTDENGRLVEIRERTHIVDSSDGPLYTEDGKLYHLLPMDSIASLNLWGFSADFMQTLDERFAAFLQEAIRENPLKAEYFLPEVVGGMLRGGKAVADVLHSRDTWYGMTYQEDRPQVAEAIARFTAEGLYPEKLWR